jgi:hypothetical protein
VVPAQDRQLRAQLRLLLAVVVAHTMVTHGTGYSQAVLAAAASAATKVRTVKTDLPTVVEVLADVVTVQATNQPTAAVVLLLLDMLCDDMHFKTTYNILKKPWEDELYTENWLDSDKIILPKSDGDWDYGRPLTIDDIDIWEILYESGGSNGVYAAYSPYAEFYMIRVGYYLESQGYGIETYYGPGADADVQRRCKELNIPLPVYKEWVEPADMWLYNKPELNLNKTIFLSNQKLS